MKIIFASDSMKGSLSSKQIITLLQESVEEIFSACSTIGFQIADGGEGTVDAMVDSTAGKREEVDCLDPLGQTIHTYYGVLPNEAVVIEMAKASGLPLVEESKRDPRYTSTYGTGQLILDALEKGYRDIYIGIGGSSTNDGGIGALSALGIRFLDAQGEEVKPIGDALKQIETIDISSLDPRCKDAHFTVMCDVDNPLCGKDGATYTFGPQKGGTKEILDALEEGMKHYQSIVEKTLDRYEEIPGDGAAGGLGFGLFRFLNASQQSGIDTVLQLLKFEEALHDTDLVITGEGRADWQSAHGKVLSGIGKACKEKNIPVLAICGSLGKGYEELYDIGITHFASLMEEGMSLEYAMQNASMLYQKAAHKALLSFKEEVEK